VIEGLDRLLLSVSRHTMDQLAMILAAGALIFVTLLIVYVACAMGRPDRVDDEPFV
jgi:hypothetical protein